LQAFFLKRRLFLLLKTVMAAFKLFSGQRAKKDTLDPGLEKTKESVFRKLSRAVVGKSRIDDDVLDNLEEVLISSDVGVNTTLKIIDKISARAAKISFWALMN
jgi:fused signal recognition particle receptor